MKDPLVVVVAGPNGAGKSTTAPRLLRGALAVTEFVNADAIAQGLSAFRPESVALAAGRVMLGRLRALAAARETFAFETTLASRNFAPWLRTLKGRGFRVHVTFLSLPTPISTWLAWQSVCASRRPLRARGCDSPSLRVRARELLHSLRTRGRLLADVRQLRNRNAAPHRR
jgi:hypothetical protein